MSILCSLFFFSVHVTVCPQPLIRGGVRTGRPDHHSCLAEPPRRDTPGVAMNTMARMVNFIVAHSNSRKQTTQRPIQSTILPSLSRKTFGPTKLIENAYIRTRHPVNGCYLLCSSI